MPRRRRGRAPRDGLAVTGWRIARGCSFAARAVPKEDDADPNPTSQDITHAEAQQHTHHRAGGIAAQGEHHSPEAVTAHRARRHRVRRREGHRASI
jgi:hypothetical protein